MQTFDGDLLVGLCLRRVIQGLLLSRLAFTCVERNRILNQSWISRKAVKRQSKVSEIAPLLISATPWRIRFCSLDLPEYHDIYSKKVTSPSPSVSISRIWATHKCQKNILRFTHGEDYGENWWWGLRAVCTNCTGQDPHWSRILISLISIQGVLITVTAQQLLVRFVYSQGKHSAAGAWLGYRHTTRSRFTVEWEKQCKPAPLPVSAAAWAVAPHSRQH